MKDMNNDFNSPVVQGESDKKQITMNIDGCTIKLNLSTEKVAKIETVKRMMLDGIAKA